MVKTETNVPGVPTESEIASDDRYRGIPRGADGLPIFFIQEPDVQRDFDAKLARCELAPIIRESWRLAM